MNLNNNFTAVLYKILITTILFLGLPLSKVYALTCHDLPAKEVSSGEYTGTEGADVIVITQKDAFVDTKGGNDSVCVSGTLKVKAKLGSGNDYFRGGSGEDKVIGGSGEDTIYGKKGDDFLMGRSKSISAIGCKLLTGIGC